MQEKGLQELRFLELLNSIDAGWGDHLGQLREEKSFIQPVIWPKEDGQEFVVEITTVPALAHEDEVPSLIKLFLEIRVRGQEEGLMSNLIWPVSMREGMDIDSINALDLFFLELEFIGFPENKLPGKYV